MKCPNCDFIERDELWGDPATCPKCGAIYEKALAVKQAKAKQAASLATAARPAQQPTPAARAQAAPPPPPAASAPAPQPAATQPGRPQEVIIKDINLPFWTLVTLMVKIGIASIPAMIILTIIMAGFLSIISLFT